MKSNRPIAARPFRLVLDRRGTFETSLHVRSVGHAHEVLVRWEKGVGMRPEEARLHHGAIVDKSGQFVTQVRTERNT